MKTFKKTLAVLLCSLLLLPSLALPFLGMADEAGATVLAEFKFKENLTTEVGTIENTGSICNNGRFYLPGSTDLTEFGVSADTTSGAAITAPDIYLQADVWFETNGANINLLFLQPHCSTKLVNNKASDTEIQAAIAAKGWYTLSMPLSQFNNNDGIDVTDFKWITYFIQATDEITTKIKNVRLVKQTGDSIRTELNGLLTGEQPTEEEYISVTEYNKAFASAKTAYDNNVAAADLMTAMNVLKAAKAKLEPIPEGVNKIHLKAALDEVLPDMANWEVDASAVEAYNEAKAAGQLVYDDKAADQATVDAATKAIIDAKAAIRDISYLVYAFPAPADADENGVKTWSISTHINYDTLPANPPVDLSLHNPDKLRMRVDIRLVEGDASKAGQITLQPRDIDGKLENVWDSSPSNVLGDNEWHTFERDFSSHFKNENWYLVKEACFHFQANDAMTLEVRNMRIVDITLEENKAALAELIKTNVGDKELYPDTLWQIYQNALETAQVTIDSATTNKEVAEAQATLQAALDELGNRGVLMEVLKETLPEDKTYSADSLKAYNDAKTAAEQVLKSETANNDDINAALKAVQDAKAALVETTFLAAQFPMSDYSETANEQGTKRVEDGVYYHKGTAIHVDSPIGLAEKPVDLTAHDRTKLYMQFDIYFEADSASSFQLFFIRPTKSDGKAILNHNATEAVMAAAAKPGEWHTLSIPLSSDVKLEQIGGMSFYMLGSDQTDIFNLRVKDYRIVDLTSEPVLSTLFADNMMFQQNEPIAVFGQGGVGSQVTIELYKDGVEAAVDTKTVTVGEDGKFKAELTAQKGSYDTYSLTVKGGSISYTYRNILIGEVWVAGGQSNMEYRIQHDVNNTSILANTNANIRIFYEPSLVYGNGVDQPLTPDFSVKNAVWADGTNVERLKGCSSLAYNFSLQLEKELNVPVGFLNVSLGGTVAEAWISREGIESNDVVKNYLKENNRYFDESNWDTNFNRMSALYNQKIGALSGYNVAGMLWYQGESNIHNGGMEIYTELLTLLHEDWGRTFGFKGDDMPMIFAHIAPHRYDRQGYDQATLLAYFWEEMNDAWANSPDTMAQIPVYDLPLTHYFTNLEGQEQSNGPIHPADKIPVSERFFAAAMNMVYGGDGAYTAPVFKSMSIVGDRIQITFDHVGSGLQVKDGASVLRGFAIAGADGVYVDANAKIISKDTVEVWSDRLKEPKNVTYAFSSYHLMANLVNSDNIAAAPFRSSRDTEDKNLYLPKNWQYADGEIWVYSGHNDTTKWQNMWQVDNGTMTFDKEIKAEGDASLKVAYSDGVKVGPINGHNSVNNTMGNYKYLMVSMKNGDDRIKELSLHFNYAGRIYKASLADFDTQTTTTIVPAGGDFIVYTFDLSKVIDDKGAVLDATALTTLLNNFNAMEFVVSDTGAGCVYIDNVQFGLTDKVSTPVDPPVPAFKLGDVDENGDITAADALMALQAVTNKIELTENQKKAANVDGKESLTANDALLILQYATKKLTSF